MDKKKKAIIIIALAVFLIGLTSAIIMIGTDKKESGVKAETTEVAGAADEEDDKQIKDEEKEDIDKDVVVAATVRTAEKATVKDEVTEVAKADVTEMPKQMEQPKATTETEVQNQATTEAPRQSEQPKVTEQQTTTEAPKQTEQPTTEKQKVWHEPVYEDVWVVDVPEHTENQIVDVKYVDKCYCGHVYAAGEDVDDHMGTTPQCVGYWGDVPVYTYEEVTVPEQGHYEKKLVKDGYWE